MPVKYYCFILGHVKKMNNNANLNSRYDIITVIIRFFQTHRVTDDDELSSSIPVSYTFTDLTYLHTPESLVDNISLH